MNYPLIMAALWVAWLVSWLVAALWASRAAQRPPLGEELPYRALNVIGGLLLFTNFRFPRASFGWREPDWLSILLLCLEVVGFAFAWWARIHLGTLWSGRVTRKADHRIVDTGPYGLVRHPIYTGLLLSFYASLLLRPGLVGLAAGVVMTISFVIKLRLEERFLMRELGADAYEAYRKRVPMLVPFWPMR